MQKEAIPGRQIIIILILFLFGSSVVMGVSTTAEQDAWITLLIGAALFIPVALVYARITRLYPEKDIFEICETVVGKIAGKIITVLFCLYAIHLTALVIRNFSEFFQIVALPQTPQLVMMIAVLLVTIYLARSGMETMGRWALVALVFVLFIVVFTIVFSIDKMDTENILPLMTHDLSEMATGSFEIFSFPYAETVLFLGMAGAIRKKDSPYKIYMYAILFGTMILLSIILRNLFVLGPAMISSNYFPSYTTARIVNVADFLSRIEGTISLNLILAGLVKITVCLMAASKGTARLFGIQDYRQVVMPVGLIALALCAIVYQNTMEMFAFIRFYPYYTLPFQIILPLVIWLAAEIKTRSHKKRKSHKKAKKARLA